jgi:hypothetical protein
MKLNIPALGTKIMLLEDWRFTLYHEYRNSTLIEALGIKFSGWRENRGLATSAACVPKGTVLTIDRIYIRKGAADFNSVTFTIPKMKTKAKKVTRTAVPNGMSRLTQAFAMPDRPVVGEPYNYVVSIPGRTVRFWAKLADVNKMVVEELV